MRRLRLTLRPTPRPGWEYLCGIAGADGAWLTQSDERGRVWLTLLWWLGPLCVSLDVLVPWAAAESIAGQLAAHRARERATYRTREAG